MRNPVRVLIDAWASLDYKSRVHVATDRPWLAPTWVGDHARRLEVYKYLSALRANKAREYGDPDRANDRREYGDAALIVNIVRSAVTGDDVSLAVDGADADLPDDASPEDKAKSAAAVARLAELEMWAEDEKLQMKVVETERDAVGLGDGVYALGINLPKGRTRLRCYDPGNYFPAIDPNDPEDEFPPRIDIAWEYEEQVGPHLLVKVHRITWELADLPAGETRSYPWNDKPTSKTCYLTDAVWSTEDLRSPHGGQLSVENFPMDKAQFVDSADGIPTDRIDLKLDFIPVVHKPNTVAIKEHFGESILSSVAQLLDDIQAGDTTAMKAAALAGTPMVSTGDGPATGPDGGALTVRPGLMVTGTLTPLDLSAALDAIMRYNEANRDLLSVNTRIPPEVLGRVKGADQPSGVKVALSFGPLRGLIEEMRLVRKEKDALLLKMVQRMQIAAGWWSGEVLPATITYGSFLPSDQTATIEAVSKLFAAHLISRKTAIGRLVEEGIIQVDLADELEACEAEDFAAALAYFEATEDAEGVFDLLHRDQPDAVPETPTLDLRLPGGNGLNGNAPVPAGRTAP